MLRLTAPGFPVFFLALLCGVAGLLGKLGYFAIATPYAFWLVATGFVLLVLSSLFRGL